MKDEINKAGESDDNLVPLDELMSIKKDEKRTVLNQRRSHDESITKFQRTIKPLLDEFRSKMKLIGFVYETNPENFYSVNQYFFFTGYHDSLNERDYNFIVAPDGLCTCDGSTAGGLTDGEIFKTSTRRLEWRKHNWLGKPKTDGGLDTFPGTIEDIKSFLSKKLNDLLKKAAVAIGKSDGYKP